MLDQNVHVFPNLTSLSSAAADDLTSTALLAVKERSRCLIALSGGSTPQELYVLLTESPYKRLLPWNQMHFFWGDERCVPPDQPGSNYGQAKQLLFDHVPVPAANIHRIPGDLNPEGAARVYAEELAKFSEDGLAWPHFDWVLLGLGEDGHTASLFPGKVPNEAFDKPVIGVTAEYQDRPAQRVTLTPLVFNSAHRAVFLVSGEGKAEALARTLASGSDPKRWPAKLIKPVVGEVVWLVDQAAASQLKT